ncbi:hypothetical protein HK104_003266 [Borealophlyctis nickersoniae]|nr:hypothetical protein HK104_003266 [Borealophlyctis nickersoniae]
MYFNRQKNPIWANKGDVIWIKGALERRGYSIWFDEERMPEVGDIYDDMWEGISRSKVVCPFLSVHYELSPNSKNCKRELETAADLKQSIVPIRLDCGPFKWARVITAGLLFVDFSDKSHDRNKKMDELVNRIVSGLEELKQLLDPTDIVKMENVVEEVNRKRLPGTREWLLQDVKDWAEDSGASSIFWLVALAGAGKSVVAASAINELQAVLGAFFVCKTDQSDRNDPFRLVRTLAYQIALKFDVVAQHIYELEEVEPGFIGKLNVSRAFKNLVVDPLTKLQSQNTNEQGRADFLYALGNITLPKNVKLLVTSRPESDIPEALQHFAPYEILLDETRNQTDLLLFAKDRMTRKFSKSTDEKNQSRAKDLAGQSHGLFMWLYLASEEIRKASNGKMALARLLEGGKVSADCAMDDMYKRALSSAFEGEGDDDQDWSDNFRLVVGAIVTVRVPLDVGTLSHLLELDENTVENTLGRIASLLYIADDQVRVVHKSFADFLTDPKRCTDPRFQIDQTVHNQ